MTVKVENSFIERPVRPLGVRPALLIFASPRSVFRRVEDTGAYGWALLTLLGLVTLIGYATVQTGLIDTVVDGQTREAKAEIEKTRVDLVDRVELTDAMEEVDKQGEFNKTMARLGAVVFDPVWLLGSYLLIAAFLYAIVALTGRKPEYHTLMSICVYSGFIELVGFIVAFAMRMHYRTLDLDTSLGVLATPGEPSPLVGVDPFRIWFWILVAIGLTVTQQLSRRMAIISCTLMCLIAIESACNMRWPA